jgi:hypothetical protein
MIITQKSFLGKMLYNVLPYIITFMHFTLFLIGNFKFTFATIFDICFLLGFLGKGFKVKGRYLLVLLGLVLYPLLVIMFFKKGTNVVDFLQSYFLYTNLALMVVVILNVEVLPQPMWKSIKVFITLGVLVACLTILQYITLNMLHTSALLNPFGPFSPPGPGGKVYHVFDLATVKRPNALYSEPSINGWYLSMISVLAFFYGIYNKSTKYILIGIFVSIAGFLTFSASAQINLIIIYLLLFMYKYRKNIFIVTAITLAGIVVIFGTNLLQSNSNSYLGKRLNEYDEQGTSTYFRLVAPSILISQSIVDYPFGYPLGDVDYIKSKPYMLNWESGSNTDIDNSFFFVIFYFGYVGTILIVILLIWMVRHAFKLPGMIFITLLLALSETGALWAPEIVLFSVYSLCIYKFSLTQLNFSYRKNSYRNNDVMLPENVEFTN